MVFDVYALIFCLFESIFKVFLASVGNIKIFVLHVFLFVGLSVYGQNEKTDTTLILINDVRIQIEATEALNDLYNFKFDKAEQQFRWFKQKYAWHPLPYFLLGLSEWWKIMPNTKKTVLKYALQTAVRYKGKAQLNNVKPKVICKIPSALYGMPIFS